jgi:hypothetical protein
VYARDRLPVYWIINIPERIIEVYTGPKGGRSPAYGTRKDFGRGSRVPVVLRGEQVAEVAVNDFLGDL